MPGKADWLAYGLPIEAERGKPDLVIYRLQREIPYCHLTDRVSEALERLPGPGPVFSPVLNDDRVVLGLLTDEAKKADPGTPVEEVMELGPATIRPSAGVEETLHHLSQNKREKILVTSSDGKFIGLFARDDEATKVYG